MRANRFHAVGFFLLIFNISTANAEWYPQEAETRLVEVGALNITGEEVDVPISESALPSYRIETFQFGEKRTRIKFELNSSKTDPETRKQIRPFLAFEGPLSNYGDKVEPGQSRLFPVRPTQGRAGIQVTVKFDKPGVYRLVALTREAKKSGKLTVIPQKFSIKATCLELCTRPEIPAPEFFAALKKSGKLDAVLAALEKKISSTGENAQQAQLTEKLKTKFKALSENGDFSALNRWPVLPPMHETESLRLLLLGAVRAENQEDPVLEELDLVAALNAATEKKSPRSQPLELSREQLPGIAYGHFPDGTLTPRRVAHSIELAKILTSLSVGNDSSVVYNSKTITDPVDLLNELVATKHKITLSSEKMYADFFALAQGQHYVRWPKWGDTGVKIDEEDEQTLATPLGHAQNAWTIEGPHVSAKISFFLGLRGAAFFPDITRRPYWTGEDGFAVYTLQSGKEKEQRAIVKALAMARDSLQLNRVQRKGLVADGYAQLGACTDSTAPLEYIVDKTMHPERESWRSFSHPYIRPTKYDEDVDGELGEALRAIVFREGDASSRESDPEAYHQDALCRIFSMFPFTLNSANKNFVSVGWDQEFWKQMRRLDEKVGKTCRF